MRNWRPNIENFEVLAMTSHLDSEKLTKIISGLCFAGAVLVGHTFAGDAAAETVNGAELREHTSPATAVAAQLDS